MDVALAAATIASVTTDTLSQVLLDSWNERLVCWQILGLEGDTSGLQAAGKW